jgi:putative nucleotidyltransferase with HDIG domain
LVRELESPLCSAARLGRIIERDPSLTAKVLQYANSAAVGARREVTEAVDAVRLLGCEAVSSLALAVHAFSRLEAARLPSFSQKRLWEHSLAVAGAARAIASEERARAQGDESFTAGLLHDVGKLVLASNLPDWYGQAVELARAERLSDHEAEREVFGATHAEVGAYLLSLWGLPGAVVEAVAHHHEPRRAQAASFSALAAVHAANALLHEAETHGRADAAPRLDVCFLQGLGLDEHLDAWRLALG